MSVGSQPTSQNIDQSLTKLALALRQVCRQIQNLSTEVNYNNAGSANLQAWGYSPADAATALTLIGYMTTISGVYLGTVQQGGSGGTGAILFNFENALSQLWGGTV